jgi:DNA-directed RNA polymerase subunit RPC12/RpoP
MMCYRCGAEFADDQPFYNDYAVVVCKPCFLEAQRCFVCRFPGRELRDVAGLGLECEFCRGKILAEGEPLADSLPPIVAFVSAFGCKAPLAPRFAWTDRLALREMQTIADLPPEAFMDDFLRFAYPVYYKDGKFHLLRRMTRPTFVVYMAVQVAAAHVAGAFQLHSLAGKSPFHTAAQGWCHWIGYEASAALKYDLERRQLRKWPELGLQGEFDRWEAMARIQRPPKVVQYFWATIGALAKKHLPPAVAG